MLDILRDVEEEKIRITKKNRRSRSKMSASMLYRISCALTKFENSVGTLVSRLFPPGNFIIVLLFYNHIVIPLCFQEVLWFFQRL